MAKEMTAPVETTSSPCRLQIWLPRATAGRLSTASMEPSAARDSYSAPPKRLSRGYFSCSSSTRRLQRTAQAQQVLFE